MNIHRVVQRPTMPPTTTKLCGADGHVDGSVLSSRMQHSWQPCVAFLDAVHMTAGHNALRGKVPVKRKLRIFKTMLWP